MTLNHKIWLPHLKFILQTISVSYPTHPNDVTIKKYYEFIQNLPVFVPMEPFGDNFLKMLDEFPVTPYLSSRLSFMKWVNFIFNKINKQLGLETENFHDSLEKYYESYQPEELKKKELYKKREKYVKLGFLFIAFSTIVYFYNKY